MNFSPMPNCLAVKNEGCALEMREMLLNIFFPVIHSVHFNNFLYAIHNDFSHAHFHRSVSLQFFF
jgi:hypothetical protein